MLHYPQFDPVALRLGPLTVHWYGLMYLVGFGLAWLLGRWRIKHGKSTLSPRNLEDIIFYGVLGAVLGGRLGYVLFYKPAHYLSHPWEMLYLWEGGMAFHGGLIGVVVVLACYARKHGMAMLAVTDNVAPLIPLGLAAGRLGNFINGELWGRPSSVPWAMVFPQTGDGLARHPSQLYQMGLEGVTLFVLLWVFAHRARPLGQVSAVFLMGYGGLRFLAEFAREPDDFLGLLTAGLSMGQWLSIPMVLLGIALYLSAKKRSL